ncbi:MAG: hypothetical protein ACFBRM_02845 [Pikeienuella sp.]
MAERKGQRRQGGVTAGGLVLFLLLAVGGCAGPTPFLPTAVEGIRLSETKLAEDRYRIEVIGTPASPAPVLESLLLNRAAELTLIAGYDWFRVTGREPGLTTLGTAPLAGESRKAGRYGRRARRFSGHVPTSRRHHPRRYGYRPGAKYTGRYRPRYRSGVAVGFGFYGWPAPWVPWCWPYCPQAYGPVVAVPVAPVPAPAGTVVPPTALRVAAEIQMARGEPPTGLTEAYDARQVRASLAGIVAPPG